MSYERDLHLVLSVIRPYSANVGYLHTTDNRPMLKLDVNAVVSSRTRGQLLMFDIADGVY
jgi:hypothetical protein